MSNVKPDGLEDVGFTVTFGSDVQDELLRAVDSLYGWNVGVVDRLGIYVGDVVVRGTYIDPDTNEFMLRGNRCVDGTEYVGDVVEHSLVDVSRLHVY